MSLSSLLRRWSGSMSEREWFEFRRAEWVRLVVADVKSRMK